MIGEEKFKELIQEYYTYDLILDNATNIFPNIFESKLIHFAWKWFDEIFKSSFTKEGNEWIDAFLYEDCREWWDDSGKHELETIDDLWELVKNHRI